MLRARQRAEKKLVTDDDMEFMLEQTKGTLLKVISDKEQNKIVDYNKTDIIKVRNTLVAAATVRLARRSKELMTMTLNEVAEAECIEVQEQEMFIVMVRLIKVLKTYYNYEL